MREPVVLSWSGGKDSSLALHEIQTGMRYEVAALLTTVTQPYDRISMHGVRRTLLERQAESLGLPLHTVFLSRVCRNEEYEQRMAAALAELRKNGIRAVAFGDIFLEDLRAYREKNLAEAGMKAVFPIWKQDTRELVRRFLCLDFQAVVVCVDTTVLEQSFAGRQLDEEFLRELPEGVDPCGENGEFHSFVFDGPIFRRPIHFGMGESVLRDKFCFCDLLPL